MVNLSPPQPKSKNSLAHRLRKVLGKIRSLMCVDTSVESQLSGLPSLMLPSQTLFSISTNEFSFLNLPETQGKIICGSSKGWLIMLDNTRSKEEEIFMLNPFTRAQIQLPPLSPLFDNNDKLTTPTTPLPFVHKALHFSEPGWNPFHHIVLIIYGEFRKLAFHKEGDKTWSVMDEAGSFYDDAVSHNGDLYAVDDCGRVVLCDVGCSKVVKEVARPWVYRGNKVYLIVLRGNLHLVIRYIDVDPESGFKTSNFKVYMLNREAKKWQLVRCLGNWAIFVGLNQSMSVSSDGTEGVKGNCIYFTDDRLDGSVGGHDLGVFSLEDESFEPLLCNPTDSELFWPPPIWFTPKYS